MPTVRFVDAKGTEIEKRKIERLPLSGEHFEKGKKRYKVAKIAMSLDFPDEVYNVTLLDDKPPRIGAL